VKLAALIDSLDRFGRALPHVVAGMTEDDARWRPAEGAWSILEIVCHLGDEEVDDFRQRVRLTLEDSTRPWPPIDPEGWATERRYNEGRLDDAVARFVSERQRSVEWLRELSDPDWEQAHAHPRFGPIRAGDVMTAWTAHDALHLRQIAKRQFQLAARDGRPFTTDYAGDWSA
jgi:hypothetical protein